MNLSGRLLDAFLALEHTRRFSLAAQRCHMSASAFSQMITRLEQQVGARLFDRNTRNVALTPEGEVFAKGAQRIDADMKSTLAELRDRSQRRVGRVAVAAPPTLASSWMPNLLAQFRQQHPGIDLRLFDELSGRCMDLVDRGEVDFGLNTQPGTVRGLDSTLLFRERRHVVCLANDSLAHKKSVALRDLRGRPFLHTSRTGGLWQDLQPLLKVAAVVDSGFEVNQLGTLAGLVAAGFGISIVPHCAIELCQRQDVVCVPLSGADATRPVYLVQRHGRSLSAAAQTLLEMVVAAGKRRDLPAAKGAVRTPRAKSRPTAA